MFSIYVITLFYILHRQISGRKSCKTSTLLFLLSPFLLCPQEISLPRVLFPKLFYWHFAKLNNVFGFFMHCQLAWKDFATNIFVIDGLYNLYIFCGAISQVCSKLATKIFAWRKRSGSAKRCYHKNGSVGRVQSKECYFMLTYTFLAFFVIFHQKICFYNFHSFFWWSSKFA